MQWNNSPIFSHVKLPKLSFTRSLVLEIISNTLDMKREVHKAQSLRGEAVTVGLVWRSSSRFLKLILHFSFNFYQIITSPAFKTTLGYDCCSCRSPFGRSAGARTGRYLQRRPPIPVPGHECQRWRLVAVPKCRRYAFSCHLRLNS